MEPSGVAREEPVCFRFRLWEFLNGNPMWNLSAKFKVCRNYAFEIM